MKLSVVILNYNVRYFLELCLQSVEASIQDLDAEIIVVDNNSKDESCTMVKQKFPNVKLIENKDNLGFSKGNNTGVVKAKGEYVCILNPDTVVTETTFKNLLNIADTKDKLGILGCQLIDGTGQFLPESKRNIPTPNVAIKKALGNSKQYYANHIDKDASGQVSVFVGAFMLIKRGVYNQVGGFDEDYFMYGEDIDLSYKIEKAGYKNYYVGSEKVIHFKGESTLKDSNYAKRFYGAMQIFYKKHFKQNILFDAVVFLGIKTAKFLKSNTKIEDKKPERYTLISNNNYEDLERKIKIPFTKDSVGVEFKENTQVILDANTLSYEAIIKQIATSEKNKNITFKILPKMANFILGSNSSKSRGEVITF